MKFVTTQNYEKFKFVKWNRPIDWNHVQRLKVSIQAHGLLQEIQCTKDYKILDGQHRYYALKALGMPVQAILKETNTENDVHEMNDLSKGWTILDILNEFVEKGNPNYIDLHRKIEIYKDKFPVGSIILAYNKNVIFQKKLFKNGDYLFFETKGNRVLSYADKLSEVIQEKAYQTKFIKTLINVMARNRNFDIKRLLHAARNKKLYIYNNEKDTYNSIVEIYNYKLRSDSDMIK